MQGELPEPCREFVDTVLGVDLAQDMQDNVFILSASFDGDLLNQWQHYAHRGGFAVGLDVAHTLAPRVNPHGMPSGNARNGPFPGWHRVVYVADEQTDWAKQMLIHTVNCTPGGPVTWKDHLDVWPQMTRSCRLALQTLICQFKHPAFAAEREVRFLATPIGPEPHERFRTTPDGRIAAFIALAAASYTGQSIGVDDGLLPIREVVCGPSSDANAEESVRRLLRASGYNEVTVRSSTVPYR